MNPDPYSVARAWEGIAGKYREIERDEMRSH